MKDHTAQIIQLFGPRPKPGKTFPLRVMVSAERPAAAYSRHEPATLTAENFHLRKDVNKHRSGTPGLREGQPIDLVRELGGQPGPNRRRSGPHPERISSCYIKALRSFELGSRFGAFSQDMLRRPKVFHKLAL